MKAKAKAMPPRMAARMQAKAPMKMATGGAAKVRLGQAGRSTSKGKVFRRGVI